MSGLNRCLHILVIGALVLAMARCEQNERQQQLLKAVKENAQPACPR